MRAGRGPELAQEAQRHLALHASPQLPAREPAPEARLARRRQPLLHVLDHVHRRRPPEPCQQRPRQRVRVFDRPRSLAVGHPPRRGVRKRQRLLALVVRIVEHRHLDRLRRLARLERQRAARRRVVVARVRAAVLCRVVDRQSLARGTAERHRERQHHSVAFLHPRIGHRDPQRARHRGRRAVGQRPAVVALRADRPRRPAVAPGVEVIASRTASAPLWLIQVWEEEHHENQRNKRPGR